MSVVPVRAAAKAVRPCSSAPGDLASLVTSRLADEGTLAPVSHVRVTDLIRGFADFLAASGVRRAADIFEHHAESFVRSLTHSGSEPSLATMHLRRSALRIFFREAKALGVLSEDPTSDIVLPSRTYQDLRALTDAEVKRCRSAAAGMLGEPRYALAWALAEATARIPELHLVRQGDIGLELRSVHLAGSSATQPRWAPLTDWGRDVFERAQSNGRLEESAGPLLHDGKANSRGSAYELIAHTLRRVGLANDPGVRANSVPAWRGAKELAEGATIDEVARLLGMRSLDRTASFIGFDWTGRG